MIDYRSTSVTGEARTLPGANYSDPEIFAAERERIFYRHWVCVGREEQIPAAGDYMLATVGEESLIVVRDQSGAINAFYNVCRHRGSRLCTAERGHVGATIQCSYHAWTYDLRGALVAARHMGNVEGFDRTKYPLYPVAVARWEGFILLNLAAEPEPFDEAFAPLIDKWSAWHMADLRVGERITYEVAANWKLLIENYSECYHCPLIHPALVRLSPADSGRNDLTEGPFLGGYMTLNQDGGSMTMDGATSRAPIGDVQGDALHQVWYYSLFPTMLLSLHPDYVMAHTLWPLDARRTRVVCEWLFAPEAMAQPGFDASDAVGFWDMTNRQDWQACESAQLGISSRAYTPGPYAHQEGLLDAFDRFYLARMDATEER